jgi:hypothetical protein
MRATLARRAIIFAARSEPKAIVFTGTDGFYLPKLSVAQQASSLKLAKRDRGYNIPKYFVKNQLSTDSDELQNNGSAATKEINMCQEM